MPVTITNDSKNIVTVTNDSKNAAAAVTVDEYDDTWQEAEGTYAAPNTPKQDGASKNLVTVTNDTKN